MIDECLGKKFQRVYTAEQFICLWKECLVIVMKLSLIIKDMDTDTDTLQDRTEKAKDIKKKAGFFCCRGGARFKLQTEAVLFTLLGYILQDMNDEAHRYF